MLCVLLTNLHQVTGNHTHIVTFSSIFLARNSNEGGNEEKLTKIKNQHHQSNYLMPQILIRYNCLWDLERQV